MQLVLITVLFFLFTSCNTENKKKETFITLSNNKYAKYFKIDYIDNVPILEVYNYYQGAKNEKITYNLKKLNIPIPVKNIVLLSSTHIGYIEKLNELSAIVGISDNRWIYNSELQKNIAQGKIHEIGYEQNIFYEKLLQIKPDVVFAYSVGKESLPHIKKIESLGIPVIFTAEYLEEHPLGRSEWIKFFSVFFKKEKKADSIFQEIETAYKSIQERSKLITNKPLVLLNYPFNGVWYLPNSKSYFVQLIRDAGGKYIFDTLTEKAIYPMNEEWVIYHAKDADIWLNVGQIQNIEEINFDAYKKIKALKNCKLYNHNLKINNNGANDFWEKSPIEPHCVLEDLWKIFHNPDSNLTYYYYKKL